MATKLSNKAFPKHDVATRRLLLQIPNDALIFTHVIEMILPLDDGEHFSCTSILFDDDCVIEIYCNTWDIDRVNVMSKSINKIFNL